jgi:hypothetical protein
MGKILRVTGVRRDGLSNIADTARDEPVFIASFEEDR